MKNLKLVAIACVAIAIAFYFTGCKKSSTTSPIVPTASFNVSTVKFLATFSTTETNAIKYKWNFGDTVNANVGQSTAENPKHTYAKTGSYNVMLTAYSSTNDSIVVPGIATISNPSGIQLNNLASWDSIKNVWATIDTLGKPNASTLQLFKWKVWSDTLFVYVESTQGPSDSTHMSFLFDINNAQTEGYEFWEQPGKYSWQYILQASMQLSAAYNIASNAGSKSANQYWSSQQDIVQPASNNWGWAQYTPPAVYYVPGAYGPSTVNKGNYAASGAFVLTAMETGFQFAAGAPGTNQVSFAIYEANASWANNIGAIPSNEYLSKNTPLVISY